MDKQNLVIYHDKCMDGFASAWAASQFLSADDTDYFACSYGQLPQFLSYKNIYIVDFSFPREVLKQFALLVDKIVVLDHHKTAQADLEDWLDAPENLQIIFDMNRSGAMITWDYFSQRFWTERTVPILIEYVQDRDLWRFNLPSSKEINAVVAITPKEFESYRILSAQIDYDLQRVADIGEYLSIQHQQICEQICEDSREVTINGHKGLASNCTGQFSSEVGTLLAKKSGTFGATYYSDSKGNVKWSLRSIGDFDVSAICKSLGGGGHKNASGFMLHANETDRSDVIKIWSIESAVGEAITRTTKTN